MKTKFLSLLTLLLIVSSGAWAVNRSYTVTNPEAGIRYVSSGIMVSGHPTNGTIKNTSTKCYLSQTGSYAPVYVISKAQNIKSVQLRGARNVSDSKAEKAFTLKTSSDAITYDTPETGFSVSMDNNGTVTNPESLTNLPMVGKDQSYATIITVTFTSPVMAVTLTPVSNSFIDQVVVGYDDAISSTPQLCDVTLLADSESATGCTFNKTNISYSSSDIVTLTDSQDNSYYYMKSAGTYGNIDLGEGNSFAEGDEIWIDINRKSQGTVGVYLNKTNASTSQVAVSSGTYLAAGTQRFLHYVTQKTDPWVGEQKLWILRGDGSSNVRLHSVSVHRPLSCTDVDAPTSLTCLDQTSTSLTYTWTKATNASGYTATLYSDSGCETDVDEKVLGDVATVTFTGLSATTTYYCKVQSNGDGETYCAEGGVTTAQSGTTADKAYTVTAASNNLEWGSAAADAGSLDEGETAQITATPETGYKFDSWAVSGTGSTLSSTTDNPTTLTMGTTDATVTATFRALYTYTISYNKGADEGITGSKDSETKTEDEAFTLPSTAVFERDGYVQTGWATSDGGEKAYELGGSYTTNAAQTFYPFWTATYTLTYDANGGSGSMSDSKGLGSITLTANVYTKTGYTFVGWATSKVNADAGTVAYTDKAAYTLSADATIYAVWAENYVYLLPATSGSTINSGDVINMQSGSFGGSIKALSANLSYNTYGLQFGTDGKTKASVTLNDNLKAGSVITIKMMSHGTTARGLHIYDAAGSNNVTTLGWSTAPANGDVAIFQYVVTGSDKLHDTNSFQLWRNNTVTVEYITVTNCQPGGTISASGWNTYSSNKKLDLSTLEASSGDITAYYASSTGVGTVIMKPATGIVDAGEGLMIKGTIGATFTIDAATDEDVTFEETNLMEGLPNGGTVAKNAHNYVFAWETENPTTTYGFYLVNDVEPTLGLGKAYLSLDEDIPAEARLNIVFDEEVTTGIADVRGKMEDVRGDFYNLNGQKVAQPAKGLYIVNGRKVVIK